MDFDVLLKLMVDMSLLMVHADELARLKRELVLSV